MIIKRQNFQTKEGKQMKSYDLVIRNANVVFSHGVLKKDIAVKDGKIVKIADSILEDSLIFRDESGHYLFPGMIDSHVHFSEPGREHWEGFRTGSEMMAAGGCTAFFDMPLNGIPSTVNRKACLEKAKIGLEKSVTPFALWGGLVPGNLKSLEDLADSGVIGFKAFMSESGNEEFERADDKTLLEGMKIIASTGRILALHAESAPIIDKLTEEKIKAAALSADDYLASRPILAEVEAVQRAIFYAELTGCPLHFVHITSRQAVEIINKAKREGLDVTLETCPHYLLFSHNDLVSKGAVAKCAPPLRKPSEQEDLLSLVMEGAFDMIASDHSPAPFDLKDPRQHHLFEAWGGISGGQFSLLSMIELAIDKEFDFSHIAQLTAEGPAKRFGLSHLKGAIKEGLDADFAIVSIDRPFTVSRENYFAKHKDSLYMGHTFPCSIQATLIGGKVIYEHGLIVRDAPAWLIPNRTAQQA
ncbi:allantoinase [Pradoshia sp.]